MLITAKLLREMGFKVPQEVPDFAVTSVINLKFIMHENTPMFLTNYPFI